MGKEPNKVQTREECIKKLRKKNQWRVEEIEEKEEVPDSLETIWSHQD